MRYIIIRDDDTNALTPVRCLELLYRPFLDHGLPVNLAVIPHVRTDVTLPDGQPEGFLVAKCGSVPWAVTIDGNSEIAEYLRANRGYHVAQHGYHHEYFEFDRCERSEVINRLEQGTSLMNDAGLPRPRAFIAPYDKLSRASLAEVVQRFAVLSTGCLDLRRLPLAWWPRYALKKMLRRPLWRVGRTLLLTHPGILLTWNRSHRTMLDEIKRTVENRALTVLVTHWWEYFHNNGPNASFIAILHQMADYFARRRDLKVISFADLPTTFAARLN